jgi:adenosylcobyric acid synthase
MPARSLMIFGTASDAGKSTLVAGLCRAFSDLGVRVAPFKAQNMARNAYVCADGSEIGVAQAVQALAARCAPSADHNPILLKPEPGMCSQVIVNGKPLGRFAFAQLAEHGPTLLAAMEAALTRLRAQHDLVILEGAGSPAEVNLQARDLPNLAAARASDAEILLVADIDRGGVLASIVGTLDLLPSDLRARVRGLVINKFRGDVTLLQPGIAFLQERTNVPVLGVVPYLETLELPDEDSLALGRHRGRARARLDELEVVVIDTPCLANFEDVLPLSHEAGVMLRLSSHARDLLEADLVVLAGSKNTVHDLAWLRAQGIDAALRERTARQLPIMGVCGGAQMLGQRIEDPLGVEGDAGSTAALALLPHHTRYERDKLTQQVRGRWNAFGLDAPVSGFFLHHGRMHRPEGARPAVILDDGGGEGCADAHVLATMIHRPFDHASARSMLLASLRAARGITPPSSARAASDPYALLAAELRNALDWPKLVEIALGR